MLMIDKMKPWVPELFPVVKKAPKTKRVFLRKIDSNRKVIRDRARLFEKGVWKIPEVDYDEAFAPVAKYTSLRLLLALNILRQYCIQQLDVRNYFLHGKLSKDTCVEIPYAMSIEHNTGDWLCLQKALYGLKQAARDWKNLEHWLVEMGFKKSDAELSLFLRWKDGEEIYSVLCGRYVGTWKKYPETSGAGGWNRDPIWSSNGRKSDQVPRIGMQDYGNLRSYPHRFFCEAHCRTVPDGFMKNCIHSVTARYGDR